MSEVISFRLDKSNPREAQAIEKLNRWMDRGYSSRFILTQALLRIDDIDEENENHSNHEINSVLDQLNSLLELLNNQDIKSMLKHNTNIDAIALKGGFLSSIKQGIKPGIKYER